MAILTTHDIPVSTLLIIQCTLINASILGKIKQIELGQIKGEVRNSLAREDNKYRIGIRFNEIDPKDKRTIARFLKKQKD
jgi:c-di-GMP-binding flagellar brake protein YcgR